jgi:hypothetical protein
VDLGRPAKRPAGVHKLFRYGHGPHHLYRGRLAEQNEFSQSNHLPDLI